MENLDKNFILEQISKLNTIKNKRYSIKEIVAYFIVSYKEVKNKNNSKDVLEKLVNILLTTNKTGVMEQVNTKVFEPFHKIGWGLCPTEVFIYALIIFTNYTFKEKNVTDESISKDLEDLIKLNTTLNILEIIQRRTNLWLGEYIYG